MIRIVDPDSHQAFPRLLAHVILGPLTSNLDDSWLIHSMSFSSSLPIKIETLLGISKLPRRLERLSASHHLATPSLVSPLTASQLETTTQTGQDRRRPMHRIPHHPSDLAVINPFSGESPSDVPMRG